MVVTRRTNATFSTLISSVEGHNPTAKKANLINQIRKFVAPLFTHTENWSWTVISEVMLARLEGSRCALKGGLFEHLIRTALKEFFKTHALNLAIGDKEIQLFEETYDIQIVDTNQNVLFLIPVKTRETMGGGHATLFTRDIHKSISVATQHGYQCLPIIIAESWGGHLENLPCEHYIYIPINPNQLEQVKLVLRKELAILLPVFQKLE